MWPFDIIKLGSHCTLGSSLGHYMLKNPSGLLPADLLLCPQSWLFPTELLLLFPGHSHSWYTHGKQIGTFSPNNSRWFLMLRHTAEEDTKQWDSRKITEGKAWTVWADLKGGQSATLELRFLRLIIQSVCWQLKRLPAERDAMFHFQDGFPQVATYSPSL